MRIIIILYLICSVVVQKLNTGHLTLRLHFIIRFHLLTLVNALRVNMNKSWKLVSTMR